MTDRVIDIDAKVKVRTRKAVLITTDGDNEVWLPLSQVEAHDDGVITLPEWLATEKGLI